MTTVTEAAELLNPLGYERVKILPGSTYQDASTVIIVPTLGTIHHKVVSAWQSLISPMNQKRAFLFAVGDEVGKAYDNTIKNILATPELRAFKYILTLEDDNTPPPDAHIRLLESIEYSKVDAVAGLYFTKGDLNMPMAYGNPAQYAKTGVLDFAPVDVRSAVANGHLVEVNGVACGCTLWRMDLFKSLPAPWFVTVADVVPGKGAMAFTQDLYFCQTAKLAGKRFAVDCRVKVGHLDPKTGTVY